MTVLDRVLASVDDADEVVVAGPPREGQTETGRVRSIVEDPPGGGPLAGVAAALRLIERPTVVVLAGDLPFLAGVPPVLAQRLEDAPGVDAVVPRDHQGRWQPLAAAYRTNALRAALAAVGNPHGQSMRAVMTHLQVLAVPMTELPQWSLFDIDTEQDLEHVRSFEAPSPASDQGEPVIAEWTVALARELGVEIDVDSELLLDVAKDAAHAVARPAAPITTFLVGYAAAQGGGDAAAVLAAATTAKRLAAQWDAGVSRS